MIAKEIRFSAQVEGWIYVKVFFIAHSEINIAQLSPALLLTLDQQNFHQKQ